MANQENNNSRKAAVNMVRQRIKALLDKQPEPEKKQQGDSLMDHFNTYHRHTHPDPTVAWTNFYNQLSPEQKKKVWQEHHSSRQPENMKKEAKRRLGWKASFKPLITALIVIATLLFLNYNQLVIAKVKQYISPGGDISSSVIISPDFEEQVSREPKIIIPKINVDIPVVYGETSYAEKDVQKALEKGVVHYGETALPGNPGNNVIVGHSANNFFNPGKYKYAFTLLSRLDIGDAIILHYKGTRYIYKVTTKRIVNPDDISVIQPTNKPHTTLITCDPPGTNWKRLVIQAKQISPEPTTKSVSQKKITPDEVPGTAPSLIQRFFDWLF